jgi:protease I
VEWLGIVGDGELRIPAEMKALILTGRMVQDQELIVPQAMLQAAGYDVTVAAEKEGEFFGIQGVKFKADMAFHHAELSDYSLLIIPGGVKCMEHIRLNPLPKQMVSISHAEGKVIGCICSGAFLLISAGLCKGRKIATYPAWKEDVENAGGTFVNDVVVDDRIVTAPHYNVAGKWMAAVLKECSK